MPSGEKYFLVLGPAVLALSRGRTIAVLLVRVGVIVGLVAIWFAVLVVASIILAGGAGRGRTGLGAGIGAGIGAAAIFFHRHIVSVLSVGIGQKLL